MPITSTNTASAPLSPAVQMVSDGMAHLTEAQRISVAIGALNSSTMVASIPALQRTIGVVQATIKELQTARMVDGVTARSTVDPDFMRLVLKHYNAPSSPSLTTAYRHACLEVSGQLLPCCVSTELAVKHAMTAYNRNTQGRA